MKALELKGRLDKQQGNFTAVEAHWQAAQIRPE